VQITSVPLRRIGACSGGRAKVRQEGEVVYARLEMNAAVLLSAAASSGIEAGLTLSSFPFCSTLLDVPVRDGAPRL
jgi:hypothetical protein